jgi:hypothetical protein
MGECSIKQPSPTFAISMDGGANISLLLYDAGPIFNSSPVMPDELPVTFARASVEMLMARLLSFRELMSNSSFPFAANRMRLTLHSCRGVLRHGHGRNRIQHLSIDALCLGGRCDDDEALVPPKRHGDHVGGHMLGEAEAGVEALSDDGAISASGHRA